jgi:alcohol dehydrogenase (cytochrome c)
MRTQSFFRAASLAATIWAGTALAGQDEDAGNEIFQAQCSACHSNQPGANGIGPSLAGVAGRKAGALAGFHFTPALQGSGLVWTADSFTQFLADPSKLVPGTAMTVTVPEATGRTALFTYLATLKDTTAATKPTGPALPKVMGPTQAELDAAASATDGWLYASHDYAGTRFVDLKQITPANARNVRPVCLYRSDQSAPVQTSPLVYQGVMYLTFGRATVAIDAKTCRERWTYIWQPKGQEISPANRGAAIKDGTLVRGTADGYLIALDMADGSLLWSQPIASFADHQYLSMPPLIFGDLVIVGPSGADFGAKNWVWRVQARDRREGMEVQPYSRSGRAGRRNVGKRRVPKAWRRQSVDAALARCEGRHRLSAGGQSRAGLLWRTQAGRQSLHGFARRTRRQDRQTPVASPVHPA